LWGTAADEILFYFQLTFIFTSVERLSLSFVDCSSSKVYVISRILQKKEGLHSGEAKPPQQSVMVESFSLEIFANSYKIKFALFLA
jgi:hypothetical protein